MADQDIVASERSFMSDFWTFRKKYYQPEDSSAFWENLVDASEALHQKYKNNDYADQLILVCVNDIDERARLNHMITMHTKEELLEKLVDRFTGRTKGHA